MISKQRAILFGVLMFLALLITKLIGNDPFTVKSLIPPAAGGLAGGIVVYLFGKVWKKDKPQDSGS